MTQLPAPPQPQQVPRGAVIVNLVGVLLILLGVLGLNAGAWMQHVGVAVSSVTVLALGVALAMREA